jgi:hypothetical protein
VAARAARGLVRRRGGVDHRGACLPPARRHRRRPLGLARAVTSSGHRGTSVYRRSQSSASAVRCKVSSCTRPARSLCSRLSTLVSTVPMRAPRAAFCGIRIAVGFPVVVSRAAEHLSNVGFLPPPVKADRSELGDLSATDGDGHRRTCLGLPDQLTGLLTQLTRSCRRYQRAVARVLRRGRPSQARRRQVEPAQVLEAAGQARHRSCRWRGVGRPLRAQNPGGLLQVAR